MEQVNRTTVPADLLGEALEMFGVMPEALDLAGFEARATQMFRLLDRKAPGQNRAALATAIELRLKALARLQRDEALLGLFTPGGEFGLFTPGGESGLTIIHANLVKAAVSEPLIEDADGEPSFGAESFRLRVLAEGGGAGMNELVPFAAAHVPVVVRTAGEPAQTRFWEFFVSNIRNPNTRRAYARAIGEFLAWCEQRGVASITDVKPLHVAAYIEQLGRERSAPTVKQCLAAIRHLFDWLVTGQVMAVNPASSVRGQPHSMKRGKTPVLDPLEARALLDAIDQTKPVGLRDRALIGPLGLFVCAHRRGARDEGRGRLRAEPPALGSPAREGRQAPRNTLPPQSRDLPARLHRRLRVRERPEGAVGRCRSPPRYTKTCGPSCAATIAVTSFSKSVIRRAS
jgi:hypothetical protein